MDLYVGLDPANAANTAGGSLTPRRWQSGTIDQEGHITKRGDPAVRDALYESAAVMLTRYRGTTALKTWGLKLVKTKGFKKPSWRWPGSSSCCCTRCGGPGPTTPTRPPGLRLC